MPFGKTQTIIIEPDENGVFNRTVLVKGQLPLPKSESAKHEGCDDFWSWLHDTFFSGKTTDNGREYNSASDSFEYVGEANGNADPFECKYEAPQDHQGSVPVWDGIS
jgi:hypothetical protein